MSAAGQAGTIQPGSPRAWLLATRPATLIAGVVPVLVGTACAHAVGGFRAAAAAAALAIALLLQIGANFANDLGDFARGADTEARLGPTRAVQAGLLTAAQMRAATALVFVLALAPGAYLTAVAGWPVIVLGLASIAAAIAYTGGPYPLGYHGWGDLMVVLFFGFVAVCGTAWVQVGAVPTVAIWAALPVGFLATAILAVNNLRDVDTDAAAGKRTFAVRFGRGAARREYQLLVALAYAVPVALWLSGRRGPEILLPLLSAPWAAAPIKLVGAGTQGAALNRCLEQTAALLLAFGLLLALGLVL